MNSLYEISNEYKNAFDNLVIDEETGEISNIDTLDALSGAFDEKAESVACYIKNLDAFSAAVKAEEEVLKKRRDINERKAENLKKYLSACMNAVGRENIETAKCRVSFRKSLSVAIENEAAIPDAYMIETVSKRADKTAIKKAIQAGEAIDGASLVENRNIQIK